jgi:hypothetical protein
MIGVPMLMKENLILENKYIEDLRKILNGTV